MNASAADFESAAFTLLHFHFVAYAAGAVDAYLSNPQAILDHASGHPVSLNAPWA